jgi:hypothetical protein
LLAIVFDTSALSFFEWMQTLAQSPEKEAVQLLLRLLLTLFHECGCWLVPLSLSRRFSLERARQMHPFWWNVLELEAFCW